MIIDFDSTHGHAGNGVNFRSRLETEVAAELDTHNIHWAYEQPVILPDGHSPRYLPDFTIDPLPFDSPFDLPHWVEAKPQQFLYDLRDTLGVTRRAGDKFSGEVAVRNVDHKRLQGAHIEELWKPKYLAELTDEAVLLVGGVGGTSRLSVEMRKDEIVFRRDHPFVNWPGHQRTLERAEQRAESKARQAEWAATRAKAETDALAERQQRQHDLVAAARATTSSGTTRYPAHCLNCNTSIAVGSGSLRSVRFSDNSSRWYVLCSRCEW